jgi:hypothetical protein
MNSKHLACLFVAAIAAGLSGCNGSDDDGNMPAPPALSSTVVDRMGRAGVNTALTAAFNPNSTAASAIKDDYNSASNPTLWKVLFTSMIAGNLAILDSLDTNCGNQLLAGPAGAGRYNTLAGVLADDQLYVNTASRICTQYLGVEANAVVALNNDCGGRTPLYDTIDTTYSVVALGALGGAGDAINIDADGTASLDTFPFLDDPN